MRPTRMTGPALAASLVLLVGACGDEQGDSDGAEDPAADTSSDSSASPSAAPAVEPLDFGDEPQVAERYKRAALTAVDDDLITMVPSALPDGWSATGGYTPDPQWWRMEFTAPAGEVVLDQLPGTAADVLADADIVEAEDVDLSDWGTGTWSAWDHEGASVLTYDLKGSTVVLQGPDAETVRALAESLLPAEDAGEQDG